MLERHELEDKYVQMARKLNFKWVDLHSYLKDIQFVAKGLFDYKLKNLAKVLNLCNYTSEVNNGAMAFEVAIKHYTERENPEGMKDVVKYNEIDCIALYKLYRFLIENI